MTAEQWLAVLNARLDERNARTRTFHAYYEGRHRLAFATAKFRESFGTLFTAFADNWCQLVVDAPVERLRVEGFRFGGASGDADQEAWDIWQSNFLDADSKLGHREAVKIGEANLLVSPTDQTPDGKPRITVEHPHQSIVASVAGDPRRRAAALKRWLDDDGFVYAIVYLPAEVAKFRSTKQHSEGGGETKVEWQRRPGDGGGRNPLRVVPMVPLRNNPNLLGYGTSDLEPVIPLNDAANKLLADMLVASEFGAFQQRVLLGVEIPRYPADHPDAAKRGQPVEGAELRASQSRLWIFENENAKVQSFAATDLGNYVKAVETIIQHVAAQTRTPPHYLLGQSGAFPSGESLKATETGLVAKVVDKQTTFGEAWEEALRLAFLAQGDRDRGTDMRVETMWADPESRTEGQLVDSLLKMRQLGVPLDALWHRWGASQEEIIEWKRELEAETLRAGLALPGMNGGNVDGTGPSPSGDPTQPVPPTTPPSFASDAG